MPPPSPPQSPPPVPVLMEELVEEFLLRVAPDDPATLVRAALVCKPWCRLVSSPGFRRRFREHHRTPPMLGFFYTVSDNSKNEQTTRFIPTTSLIRRAIPIRRDWRLLDSRHGRVLLHRDHWDDGPFVIWDPIMGAHQKPVVLPRHPRQEVVIWSAAVFCAAAGSCDHLDCQRGAFSVVAAGTNNLEMFVCVYSSQTGAWSQVSARKPDEYFLNFPFSPGALVGNALCFPCLRYMNILKYELGTREISVIDGPPACSSYMDCRSVLMTTEDGRLGFAYVLKFKLHIWSSDVGSNSDARWTPSGVIDLARLPPFASLSASPDAIGSADGGEFIFLGTVDGVFIIDLKSGQARKISEHRDLFNYAIPFKRFYTPALGMVSTGEVPNVGVASP